MTQPAANVSQGPNYTQYTYPEEKVRAGGTRGVKSFQKWAASNLDSFRHAVRDQNTCGSVGILSNEKYQRCFLAAPDEQPPIFAERLRLEALRMRAEWAFCTYISLVSLQEENDAEIAFDGTNPLNVIAHILAGNVGPALVWSAHMKPTSVRDTFRKNPSRIGVIFTSRDLEIRHPIDGTDMFGLVLP